MPAAMASHLDPALPPAAIYASLEPAVQRLAIAAHVLFAGSWNDCAEDLRRRRAGRPYLFRLNLDLDDELGWCHRLAAYESARGESVVPPSELEKHR